MKSRVTTNNPSKLPEAGNSRSSCSTAPYSARLQVWFLRWELPALFFALFLTANARASSVVVVPVANMFSQGSADADVVSQAIYGTTVSVVEASGDWLKVETPDKYHGWMRSSDLLPLDSGSRGYASGGRVVRVESLVANVYREPDVTRHEPIMTLPFETHLEVANEPSDEGERWIEVRLADQRTAWIHRGDVSFQSPPLSIRETIQLAKGFLGLTYRWGGTSTFGFDCSGFTQMLMRQRGVLMPRDADMQAAWPELAMVMRGKLRAGDLLFFGPSSGKITHTGMFIGHGRFIHDTTYGHPGVQISRLKDKHWKQLLVAVRRLK